MSKKAQKWDFSGWATKNDMLCKDGRTIRKNAFAADDGKTVPLVWMHQHNDPMNVLGHALLENREEGVYAYCSFNDSPYGQQGKEIVRHGDIVSLSIWANELDQKGGNVRHGSIKEVSVVLAGANPGAVIDFPILAHSDEEDYTEAFIRVDEPIALYEEESLSHSDEDSANADETNDSNKEEPNENGDTIQHSEDDSTSGKDDPTVEEVLDTMNEEQLQAVEFLIGAGLSGEELQQADPGMEENKENVVSHAEGEEETKNAEDGKTVDDIIKTMTPAQQKVTKYLVAMAIQSKDGQQAETQTADVAAHSDEEGEEFVMPTNTFEAFGNEGKVSKNVMCHADGIEILKLAKANGGMSLKAAYDIYAKDNQKELMHGDNDLGFKDIGNLFPEYSLLNGPAPETLTTDQGWITKVLRKVRKSPKSRLRVRYADARDISTRRAQGYEKGTQKQFMGNLSLLGRTVDPTTIYNLDHLDRDDIVDITDFSLVDYMYQDQNRNLKEEVARQIMIGDGRNGDPENGKPIDATKMIPIWGDDELFAIHKVVDVAAMRTSMNGTNSTANFGDNYVTAEAVLQTILYAMEEYKGSGSPDFYCNPHLVNVMLLARDLNGRRIYDNVNDLKASLNVNELITAEQFTGKTRTVTVNGQEQTRRLLGILVNLDDYTVGATKGGEITHFTDFDIRFNEHLSLLETRSSGMLTRVKSAIILEEIVNPS